MDPGGPVTTMVSWIEDYDDLTVDEVHAAVDEYGPSPADLLELLEYERDHDDRVTVTDEVASRLEADVDAAAVGEAVVEERVEALEDRVDAIEAAFTENLQDVRERVVQVKREADAKAPRGHEHPEMAERLDRITDAVEQIDADLDDLEDTAITGFRNYESVLEYLTDASAELEDKLDRLAAVTLEIRDTLDEMRGAHARRAAVEQLAAEAIRHGARTAECKSCGNAVPIGMLSSPRCPHCGETFSEFAPKRGLLGTHTLVTGTHPALEPARSEPEAPGAAGPTIHDVLDPDREGDDTDTEDGDGGVAGDEDIEPEDLIERDG